MKALVINCTLKTSRDPSNTHALAKVVTAQLARYGAEVEFVRAVDMDIRPGVASQAVGHGDQWPQVHGKLLEHGRRGGGHRRRGRRAPCDQRDLRRAGRHRLHHSRPGQAWTYWHLGPGPGPDHLYDERGRGRDWSHRTGRAMAANLFGTAKALAADPLGASPE